MVKTIYTDGEHEMEVYHDNEEITIEVRATDYMMNPVECVSVKLNSFDVYQLIEDLTLIADHCNPNNSK